MKTITLLLALVANTCYSQSYEESINKCVSEFHSNFDPTTPDLKVWNQLRDCVVGLHFPSFHATDVNGQSFSKDQLKGKVVMINTWYIGCKPCHAEIPHLNKITKEFANDNFVLLSFGRDTNNDIHDFTKDHPIKFPVFADSEDLIVNKFKLSMGYPTNILINKSGDIVEFKLGGAIDEVGLLKAEQDWIRLIKEELGK